MINAKHFSPCLHNFITLKSSMSPVVYIVAAGTFSQAALIVVIEINSTKPSTLFLLWTSRRCHTVRDITELSLKITNKIINGYVYL